MSRKNSAFGALVRIMAGICLLAGAIVPVRGLQAQIPLVTGAPFTASETHTSVDQPELPAVGSKIARASNGSTYREIPDARPGHLPNAMILDVPNHRSIFLRGDDKTYSVQPVSLPPVPAAQTTDAEIRNRIELLRSVKATHDSDSEKEVDTVPLGFRTVDGQLEYGTRRTFVRLPATSKLRQKVWETWELPSLYVAVENTGYDDAGTPANVTKLTGIHPGEPDVHLFEIPAGYNPAGSASK